MPKFTRRDLAILALLVVLAAIVAAAAVAGSTNWALGSLGVLVGVTAIAEHIRFSARRVSFKHLAQQSRANRDSLLQIKRLVETLTDPSMRATATASSSSDSGRHRAAGDSRISEARATEILRREIEAIALETSAIRAELRGVRVSQQLFSQTLTVTRNELMNSASAETAPPQSSESSTEDIS